MAQSFAVDGPVAAAVRLGAGRVDVSPAPAGTATVEVAPRDPGHEPSARAAADAEVRLDGEQLIVQVPEHGRLFRRAEVIVTVGLPTGSDLAVKAGAADVAITGGVRNLAVKSGAGNVRVDSAVAVSVKSGQAGVELDSADSISVSTGQGSLRASHVRDAAFKAGSGEVELTHTAGQVAVKGGAVQLRISEAGPGAVLFDTGAGSASVGVAQGTTVEVDLLSGAGDVRCDVPLEGTGSGGPAALQVRLRTGAGDLRLFPAVPVPA